MIKEGVNIADIDNWTVHCKKCGINYDIPKEGNVTILSLKKIKFKKKPKCPVCGHSSRIVTLKNYIGYNFYTPSP